jgi:DedD protein
LVRSFVRSVFRLDCLSHKGELTRMGLLSIFQSKGKDSADRAASPSLSEVADAVQQARVRARHRLIGAAVLVMIGVIVFPLLFETQPRPVAVDIPIEIPRKEAAAPLVAPPARGARPPAEAPTPAPAEAMLTETQEEAGHEIVPPKPPEAAAATATAAASAADKPRFVVQAGAFADNAPAKEVRTKVEKLGLKTFVQTADTAEGKRIRVRVGPFNSREEADKVLARMKTAGVPAVVLAL